MLSIYMIELSPSTLIGLLCASGQILRLPSGAWAIEAALEVLARRSRPMTSVGRAILRWPYGRDPMGTTFSGVRRVVRDLERSGHLVPSGYGWEAGYVPTANFVAAHAQLLASLETSDRRALSAAAHRLVAILRTWSKNAVAPGPCGSATS